MAFDSTLNKFLKNVSWGTVETRFNVLIKRFWIEIEILFVNVLATDVETYVILSVILSQSKISSLNESEF